MPLRNRVSSDYCQISAVMGSGVRPHRPRVAGLELGGEGCLGDEPGVRVGVPEFARMGRAGASGTSTEEPLEGGVIPGVSPIPVSVGETGRGAGGASASGIRT